MFEHMDSTFTPMSYTQKPSSLSAADTRNIQFNIHSFIKTFKKALLFFRDIEQKLLGSFLPGDTLLVLAFFKATG